jgi:hypothetical protein
VLQPRTTEYDHISIYLYTTIYLYLYIYIYLLILVSISVLQPRQATETELLTIHTPAYVSAALAGTAEKDSSTYFHTKNSVSAGAARLAAGSTMQVAEEGVVVCVWVGVCVCVCVCMGGCVRPSQNIFWASSPTLALKISDS